MILHWAHAPDAGTREPRSGGRVTSKPQNQQEQRLKPAALTATLAILVHDDADTNTDDDATRDAGEKVTHDRTPN